MDQGASTGTPTGDWSRARRLGTSGGGRWQPVPMPPVRFGTEDRWEPAPSADAPEATAAGYGQGDWYGHDNATVHDDGERHLRHDAYARPGGVEGDGDEHAVRRHEDAWGDEHARDRDHGGGQDAGPRGDEGDRAAPKKEGKPRDADGKGDKASGKGKGADDGKGDEKPPMPRAKKILYGLIAAAAAAVLVVAGTAYWLYARQFESTDDAFIDGYMSQVGPQVAGRVIRIAVDDNQQVEAGQLLVELDPRDFQVRLEQARAQRANAVAQRDQALAQVALQQATIDQQQAQVRVSDAELTQAQQDLARYRSIDPRAITRQTLDQSNATTRSATARRDAARQAVAGARAQLEAARAQVEAAEAQIKTGDADIRNAELQLSYTRITAPTAGRVTRRTVNLGNYVNVGQALMAVVPDQMWVTANFKETQLNLMRPGQAVQVRVDAFPDRRLAGRVDSVQRGTGAVFSALPAENATGNYVKVVQRVPVKITFEGDDWRHVPLSPGLSVVPRVTVR